MGKQTEPAIPHLPGILRQLEEAHRDGQPLTVTVNGRHTFVLEDDTSCGQLLDLIDRLEAIEGIRRGLESMRQGTGRPLEEVMHELREKYEVSDPDRT